MHLEMEQLSLTITGGGPYGLRLAGGTNEPLVVAKLHKKSKARAAGLRVGDVILSINGNRCEGMSTQTAYNLIDYSPGITFQLLRGSDFGRSWATSSFRSSSQPQQPATSPTSSPFQSGSESATSGGDVLQRTSTTTKVILHQHNRFKAQPSLETQVVAFPKRSLPVLHEQPFAKPGTSGQEDFEEDSFDEIAERQDQYLRRRTTTTTSVTPTGTPSGRAAKQSIEPRISWSASTSVTSGPRRNDYYAKSDGEMNFSDWNGKPNQKISDLGVSTLTSEPQPPPSFLSKQSYLSAKKPQPWQPQAVVPTISVDPGIEPQQMSHSLSVPRSVDALVHEVVIWSSKPTHTDQRREQGTSTVQAQKPQTWQPNQQPVSQSDFVNSQTNRPIPQRWQPKQPQADDLFRPKEEVPRAPAEVNGALKPQPWQPNFLPSIKSADNPPKPHAWQPQDQLRVSNSSAPPSHRWQPSQQSPVPDQNEQPSVGNRFLEAPTGSSKDGSVSPTVDSLYLTRVVTDGSVLAAGSGSDVESKHVPVPAETKKHLYGDSSFYEDPEHSYPTIEEQIKMARKVAHLLTSPANQNARGQRMFLKRKEQASKWVIDPSRIAPYLADLHHRVTPTLSDPSLTILGPGEVERMRFQEEKSRHDVVPFDVCSMLATELREERGRGGKMFAKRRDKAEHWVTAETDGYTIEPPPFKVQNKSYVPESVTAVKPVTPGPPKEERRAIDLKDVIPVNRLKDMVDLPKPRITPWDSAVQYGTVEPAFEHLQVYYTKYGAPEVPPVNVPLVNSKRSQGLLNQNLTNESTHNYLNQLNVESHDSKGSGAPRFEGSSGFESVLFGSRPKDRKLEYRPVQFQVGTRGHF